MEQRALVRREGWLYDWLIALIACNSISLLVDASDVIRFVAGDRQPHYTWNRAADE